MMAVGAPPIAGETRDSAGAAGRVGRPWPLAELPVLAADRWRDAVLDAARDGGRLVGVWAWPAASQDLELLAVVAFDAAGRLVAFRSRVARHASHPCLTALLPAAQAFEREIFETFGVRPEGHPWPKPLVRHTDLETPGAPDAHPFFAVSGLGVHEVAVGPVHAGIIEPGHFRFQCAGETVLHLEIQLGYQHRGVERMLLDGTPARRLAMVESIAGDAAIGHAAAYCQALEALAGCDVPPRAQALRAVALELERIANHVGDLGALCGDVGYLPGAAYLGRLRGDFLNLLLELSGNRFGRGLIVPGGVRFDVAGERAAAFAARVAAAGRDLDEVADLVFGESSVMSRFEQAAPLSHELAQRLGLVGPAARASGCRRDVRVDHPSGYYCFAHIPMAHFEGGDVLARAMIRRVEARRSIAFVREEIERLPGGRLAVAVGEPAPDAIVVSLVEGWRGEIAHVAVTDGGGELRALRISDPSLHNWLGLALAMRDRQISDFPLANKSFNLSYAGHDR